MKSLKNVKTGLLIAVSTVMFSTKSFAIDFLSVSKTPDNNYVWLITAEDGLFMSHSINLHPTSLSWSRVTTFGTDEIPNVFNCPYNVTGTAGNLLVAFDTQNGIYYSTDGAQKWRSLAIEKLPRSYTKYLFSCTQISHYSDTDIMNIVGISGDKYMRGMLKLGTNPEAVDGGIHYYNMQNPPLNRNDSLIYVSAKPETGHLDDNGAGYFVVLADNNKLEISPDKTANGWQKASLTKKYQFATSQSEYPYLNTGKFFLVGGDNSGGTIQQVTEINMNSSAHFDSGIIKPTGFVCSQSTCFASYTKDGTNGVLYGFYDIARNNMTTNKFPVSNEVVNVENIVYLENNYFIFTDQGIYIYDASKKSFISSTPVKLPAQWEPDPIN